MARLSDRSKTTQIITPVMVPRFAFPDYPPSCHDVRLACVSALSRREVMVILAGPWNMSRLPDEKGSNSSFIKSF